MDKLKFSDTKQVIEGFNVKGHLLIHLDDKLPEKLDFIHRLRIEFVLDNSESSRSVQSHFPRGSERKNVGDSSELLDSRLEEISWLSEDNQKAFTVIKSDTVGLGDPTKFSHATDHAVSTAFQSCEMSPHRNVENEAFSENEMEGEKFKDNLGSHNFPISDEEDTISDLLNRDMNVSDGIDEEIMKHIEQPIAGIKCQLCKKWFVGRREFQDHRKNSDCQVVCLRCGKVFSSLGHLFIHHLDSYDKKYVRNLYSQYGIKTKVKKREMDRKMKCLFCSRFILLSAFADHVNARHFDIPSYKCCICEHTTSSNSSYVKHCKSHLSGLTFSSLRSESHRRRKSVGKSHLNKKSSSIQSVENDNKALVNNLSSELKQKDRSEINSEVELPGPTIKDSANVSSVSEFTTFSLNPVRATETEKSHTSQEVESFSSLKKNPLHCIYCKVTFKSRKEFVAHNKTPQIDVSCQTCGTVVPSNAWLIIHEFETHRTKFKSFFQTETGQTSSDPPTMVGEQEKKSKQANRLKSEDDIACPVCSAQVRKFLLLNHIMRMHTKESPYQCCVCGWPCPDVHQYKKHCEEAHLGIVKKKPKQFRCLTCAAVFEDKAEYNEHRRSHRTECVFCRQEFLLKDVLYKHYLSAHMEHMLKCDHCDRMFPTELKLKQHQHYHRFYNAVTPCPICGLSVKFLSRHIEKNHPDPDNVLACSECPRIFQSSQSFKTHMNKHRRQANVTGEIHTCPKCSKSFSTRILLSTHMRRQHYNNKVYQCSICGKQCKKSYNLKVHMRIHSDVKTFCCPVCGQGFNYKASLQGHMTSRHKMELMS